MTRRDDGTVRLGPIELWICAAIGGVTVTTFMAAAAFAWSANAQLAQINANLSAIAEELKDHESRIRGLERAP